MANKDSQLMEDCVSDDTKKLFEAIKRDHPSCEHPLDVDVTREISKLNKEIKNADEYAIFRHPSETDALWRLLLEKAIKCLRYFDKREPFLNNKQKKPQVYGIDELYKYYQEYKEYERLLYGSSQYYRDHVVHVLRTWLFGIRCLVRNDGGYLSEIEIHEEPNVDLNAVEKISIWTIIALTHDLGYPLEKAREIIDKTREMVKTFVTNPDITMDLSFHGVQNNMNDFTVKLMSSKMRKVECSTDVGAAEQSKYVARLQPKYYYKFLKSLGETKHGIISTLIIYKILTYFLESDYSINEHYFFGKEDRRQFYIRREILRAIASHTCTDIYHLYMCSFAFLLIISDDMQEWGRKYISELYIPTTIKHNFSDILLTISKNAKSTKGTKGTNSPHKCELKERVSVKTNDGWKAVVAVLSRLHEQALVYVTIFRDGQETSNRDFVFIRKVFVKYDTYESVKFDMTLKISNQEASTFSGKITYSSNKTKNRLFGKDFFEELKQRTGSIVTWEVFGDSKNVILSPDYDNVGQWRTGKLGIELTA